METSAKGESGCRRPGKALASAVLLGAASVACAARAAGTAAIAHATVVSAFAVAATEPLVRLTPSAGALATGNFVITGHEGLTYAVTLPGTTRVEDGTHGIPGAMTAAIHPARLAPLGAVKAGRQILWLGASLPQAAGRPAAALYSGHLSVTLEYN